MTRKEFEALLEEAFMTGYEDAMADIFDEDSSFDVMQEMDKYDKARFRDRMNDENLKKLSPEAKNKLARQYIANHASSARKFSKEYAQKQEDKLRDHFENNADNKRDIWHMQQAYARNLIHRCRVKK